MNSSSHMVTAKDIEGVVRAVLSEHLEDVEILAVNVAPYIGSDGDEFLDVTVVFETPNDLLDASKTAGLVRHMRPKLSEIGEWRFPLMSFVSREDAKQLGFEAA